MLRASATKKQTGKFSGRLANHLEGRQEHARFCSHKWLQNEDIAFVSSEIAASKNSHIGTSDRNRRLLCSNAGLVDMGGILPIIAIILTEISQ
jgi:hypothetical protein